MLIEQTTHEVPTSTGPMTIHLITPKVAGYPNARWPGVVVWSEIYQVRRHPHSPPPPSANARFQVTGPVLRFANSIAAQGYIVACPCIYHEFEGAAPIAYDGPGTDAGNDYKIRKLLSAYDSDAKAAVNFLMDQKACNGRIGSTGMCLGGHLAFRVRQDWVGCCEGREGLVGYGLKRRKGGELGFIGCLEIRGAHSEGEDLVPEGEECGSNASLPQPAPQPNLANPLAQNALDPRIIASVCYFPTGPSSLCSPSQLRPHSSPTPSNQTSTTQPSLLPVTTRSSALHRARLKARSSLSSAYKMVTSCVPLPALPAQ